MRFQLALALALALAVAAGCGPRDAGPREPAAAAAYATRPVVAEAVRALEQQLAAAAVPEAEADPDLGEHVAGLVSLVAGRDEDLARLALAEAGELGAAAVPPLAAVVADEGRSDAARAAAVRLLAALDVPAAAEVLIGTLEPPPMPAGPAVGAEPPGAPEWLKAHCAWRLGETSQDWVVPRLVCRLKYETEGDVVCWMADTLARFGNFAGIDGLLVVHESGAEGARADAERILARLAEETGLAARELPGAWWRGELGAPADEPLAPRHALEVWRQIAALSEWQLRGVDDARFLLSRLDARAAVLLGEALRDDDGYVRLHAGQSLERMGPRGRPAAPALIAALEDPHQAAQAAAALGSVAADAAERDPELARDALDALRPALAADRALDLRIAAARALGPVGDGSARAPLAALLDPAEPVDVRCAAAEGLVRLGPKADGARAVRLLAELMTSPAIDPAVPERALAAWLAGAAAAEGADGGPATDALERWRELGAATAAAEFPDLAAVRARHADRAALVLDRLDVLLP